MKNIKEKFKIYGYKKFFQYFISEIRNKFVMQLIRKSYSQKGEDLVIDKLLNNKKNGFYVDIGAYDPDRFSNTKRFYKRGWMGINIEPEKNKYRKFVNERKRDINLNIGIGLENSKMTFYEFIPDTLSTFSKQEADKYISQGCILREISTVEIKRLSDILSKYCENKKIDFFSIDTEGFDMQVLQSNDWSKFRPEVVCIESISHDINEINNKKEDGHEKYLIKLGYKKYYNNELNSVYISK
ncbi:FkbM family methyltransferase [Patescibacteria group bacterium]|nr:FkbM family methyltransferase [Patescibacteria group bacterium]